jgi:hypothetical protein
VTSSELGQPAHLRDGAFVSISKHIFMRLLELLVLGLLQRSARIAPPVP